jgi:SlyX protein
MKDEMTPFMQDDPKLIDLEIKLAHAERALEELSDVVYKQQVQIEKLDKKLNLLAKKFESNSGGELEIGPANEKPPHY